MHSLAQCSLEQFTKKNFKQKNATLWNFSCTYGGGNLVWPLPVLVVWSCAETRNFSSHIKEVASTATYFLELWKLSFIVNIWLYKQKDTFIFILSFRHFFRGNALWSFLFSSSFIGLVCCRCLTDMFYFSENKQNIVCWFQQVSWCRERNWYCKSCYNPGHWW